MLNPWAPAGMGKMGHLPPPPENVVKCFVHCKTLRRRIFMHYFHNLSSASGIGATTVRIRGDRFPQLLDRSFQKARNFTASCWQNAGFSIWVFKKFPGVIPRTSTAGGGDPLSHPTPSAAFGRARAQAPWCWDPNLGPPQFFSRGCAPGLWRLRPRPSPGLPPWTLGDFRPQTPNLPTPGKNPAGAHGWVSSNDKWRRPPAKRCVFARTTIKMYNVIICLRVYAQYYLTLVHCTSSDELGKLSQWHYHAW